LEGATTPREPRVGNVADFKKLDPMVFTGNEKLLQAEQWLTDTENLLKAARVPEADQVEIVKIQLADIARSGWLAEEARLTPPITWKKFTDGFYERFFPSTAQQDMEEEFINLKQSHRTVDEYAAEFLRLSRVVKYMNYNRREQSKPIPTRLEMIHPETVSFQRNEDYSEVLTAARRVEQITEKKNRAETQQRSEKRLFEQVVRESPPKKQLYQHIIRESPPSLDLTSPKKRSFLFCEVVGNQATRRRLVGR
jgi:hypothetical protein